MEELQLDIRDVIKGMAVERALILSNLDLVEMNGVADRDTYIVRIKQLDRVIQQFNNVFKTGL